MFNKLFILILFLPFAAAAQEGSRATDTLEEVRITAFGGQRGRAVAASVSTLQPADFALFSPVSPLPAMNTLPGVRMEERSPGSYRLGIRGSALQAPFGVRNVKVYYNEIPLTDPGGTTYLNALGTGNFGRVEVVRGSGSSLYGSGTGGVVLLNGPASVPGSTGEITLTGGAFGLLRSSAFVRLGDTLQPIAIGWEHTQSSGYRAQSALQRNVFTGEGQLAKTGKGSLFFTALYSDLEYETPGALTFAEYKAHPKAARPPAGASPGAVAAGALIKQQLTLLGLTGKRQWNNSFSGKATLYASSFRQENPNIRNYSFVIAPHFGGRTEVNYNHSWGAGFLTMLAGVEVQKGLSSAEVFSNKGGNTDTIQSIQSADYQTGIAFLQASYSIHKWTFTAGGSENISHLRLLSQSVGSTSVAESATIFYKAFAPRLSVLRTFSAGSSFFLSASKGFSPPPLDAVAPTGSPVFAGLQSQQGWTYEAGYQQSAFKNHLQAEATVFWSQLKDFVVVRRDAAGGDTYVNAGTTLQPGIEAAANYQWGKNAGWWGTVKTAYTGYYFKYDNFLTAAGDFSGSSYPGVAPHTVSVATTVRRRQRWSISATYFYSAAYWANDANTAAVNAYHLLGIRADYSLKFYRQTFTLTAGGDNLLNQLYTLGPDLNAFGSRYYNAAPGPNGYVGIKWNWMK